MKKYLILLLIVFSFIQVHSQIYYTNKSTLVSTLDNIILKDTIELSQFMFNDAHVTFTYNGTSSIFSVISILRENRIISYRTINSKNKIIYFHIKDNTIGMNDEYSNYIILFNIYLK